MAPSLARLELVVLCVCFAALTLAATQIALGLPSTQQTGDAKLGAVASENKICSNIGIELLRAGGNAADAVIYSAHTRSLS